MRAHVASAKFLKMRAYIASAKFLKMRAHNLNVQALFLNFCFKFIKYLFDIYIIINYIQKSVIYIYIHRILPNIFT